jgi:SAM-dependent methyltransferase
MNTNGGGFTTAPELTNCSTIVSAGRLEPRETEFPQFQSPRLISSCLIVLPRRPTKDAPPAREKEPAVNSKDRVCPVELSGGLDNAVRRWLQNPRKILEPYVKEGMTVLDSGCGPGFFTLEMGHLVGASGRVIACDLQDGMLQKLSAKIKGTPLANVITMHKCEKDRIGVSETVDFVLVFYMLHEVPNQEAFLKEICGLLKPSGQVLVVEPPFHVSRSEFSESVNKAKVAGLKVDAGPRVFLGRTALFQKC